MEFDINIILVPITLVLLLAYLADKFWLKQHKLVANHQRELDLATTHFEQLKKEFQALLIESGHKESPDDFVGHERSPTTLLNSHIIYKEARQKVFELRGQAPTKITIPKEHFLVRWAYEYLPILLVIVLVRSFVVEAFNIPSSSMVPSLHTGDFIVVNKAAYGLRLPITHTKILNTGQPSHGDVAVFRYPENPKRYYIKRVIGLPGDTVGYDNGVLSINGKAVATDKSDFVMAEPFVSKLYPDAINGQKLADHQRQTLGQEEERHAHYYTENLGEHSYQVRYLADLNSSRAGRFLNEVSSEVMTSGGKKWQITVPENQYFVMGDNRDRSEDSRFWGFVPEANLAGKATYIWMHKEAGLKMPSFSRAGKID